MGRNKGAEEGYPHAACLFRLPLAASVMSNGYQGREAEAWPCFCSINSHADGHLEEVSVTEFLLTLNVDAFVLGGSWLS